MKLEESLGQFSSRVKSGGGRKPMRSLRELAEEFGTTPQALSRALKKAGITSAYRTKNIVTQNIWYDPEIVRAWWKAQL